MAEAQIGPNHGPIVAELQIRDLGFRPIHSLTLILSSRSLLHRPNLSLSPFVALSHPLPRAWGVLTPNSPRGPRTTPSLGRLVREGPRVHEVAWPSNSEAAREAARPSSVQQRGGERPSSGSAARPGGGSVARPSSGVARRLGGAARPDGGSAARPSSGVARQQHGSVARRRLGGAALQRHRPPSTPARSDLDLGLDSDLGFFFFYYFFSD